MSNQVTRRQNLLPNVVTALALCCGLFVIFKMALLQSNDALDNQIFSAFCLLLVAAFLDVLDGAIARAMHSESDFGGFFDSMSDAVTFGIAPSVLVLKTCSLQATGISPLILTAAAMIYSVSGVFRLVRYSVTSHRVQKDPQKLKAFTTYFTGLPIPAAAIAITSVPLFMFYAEKHLWFQLTQQVREWWIAGSLTIVGYLMASTWKFPSLKSLNFHVDSYRSLTLLVLFSTVILMFAINHFAPTLFFGFWCYIAIFWGLSLFRMLFGREGSDREGRGCQEGNPDEEEVL